MPQPSLWTGQIFPVKACENSEDHSRHSILYKRKVHVYFKTNYGKKSEIWKTNSSLSRNKYRQQCTSPWRRTAEIKHWSILTASKHPHKSFSRCCCSLLIQVNALKHLDARFKESNTLRTSQLVIILSLCSGSGLLASPRGSASEFWKTVEHKLQTMGIQKLKGIFSITHTNLCAWFKILVLAVEDECWMT